jgi:hypothetical protein
MFGPLLVVAFVLLACALAVLVYLALTTEGFSFHGIWEKALEGHRPSQLYMALVLVAFCLALANQVLYLRAGSSKTASSKSGHAAPELQTVPSLSHAWHLQTVNRLLPRRQ